MVRLFNIIWKDCFEIHKRKHFHAFNIVLCTLWWGAVTPITCTNITGEMSGQAQICYSLFCCLITDLLFFCSWIHLRTTTDIPSIKNIQTWSLPTDRWHPESSIICIQCCMRNLCTEVWRLRNSWLSACMQSWFSIYGDLFITRI